MAYKLPVPASLVTGLGAAALVGFGAIANTAMEGNDSRVLGAVQSSVLTTRGDLLRRGASAPERFAASTADTFVGGDGTDVGVRTAPQVWVSLVAGRTTTPSLASTSGWTNSTSGSGATSTQNTGTGQMELAVNDNGGTARFLRTMSVPVDWRAQVRVRTFTDTTANIQATFSVYQSASPTEGPRFTLYGDGSLRTQYVPYSGSTVTVRAQTAAISAVRAAMTAGTLWMRMQSQGGCIGWLYAVGSTESTLVWVTFGTYALPGSTDGERVPDTYNVSLNRVASSGAQTATIDSVSWRDLSP